MSFKPQYAYQILHGLKTCEVRTCFKHLNTGDTVVVYASSPIKAILGYLVVGYTTCSTYNDVEELIEKYKCRIPCDNWLFVEEHYRDSNKLLFFTIRETLVLGKPITLSMIKKYYPGFKPPRSYVEVSIQFLEKLIREQQSV